MPAPNPDLAPLVGSWRLLSAGLTFTDTGERVETWGPNPDGRMVIDPGGRLMFFVSKSNRRPPVSEAERADLFNSMMVYTGIIRLEGTGRFITAVDVSWNPAFGGDQIRNFTIFDNRLVIKSTEFPFPDSPNRFVVGDSTSERQHSVA